MALSKVVDVCLSVTWCSIYLWSAWAFALKDKQCFIVIYFNLINDKCLKNYYYVGVAQWISLRSVVKFLEVLCQQDSSNFKNILVDPCRI